MIHVRRTAEHPSPVFEVSRRKERDTSPRHDVARDVRTANGRQASAGALSGGGLPVLARPRAKGVDPQTLRRDGDLALFPRVRAGDATLSFAVVSTKIGSRLPIPRSTPIIGSAQAS